MLNPARLAWGLKKACLQLGVRFFEGSPVTALEERREHLILKLLKVKSQRARWRWQPMRFHLTQTSFAVCRAGL